MDTTVILELFCHVGVFGLVLRVINGKMRTLPLLKGFLVKLMWLPVSTNQKITLFTLTLAPHPICGKKSVHLKGDSESYRMLPKCVWQDMMHRGVRQTTCPSSEQESICKLDSSSLGIQTLEFFRRIPRNLDSFFLNQSYFILLKLRPFLLMTKKS